MLTEEQLAKRKLGIGGSDVAAILGLSEYATAVDVFLEKTTDYVRPVDPNNPHIWWGHKLENPIIERFLIDYPQEHTKPDTIYDKDIPFLFANVDALLEDGSVIDAKNVGRHTSFRWGAQFTNQAPREYLVQVLHYSAIVNSPSGYLAAYFGGADLRVYEQKRDPVLEKMVRDELCSFWENNVLKGIVPEATCLEDQRKIWKKATLKAEVQASEEIVEKVRRRMEIVDQIKVLEEEESLLKMDICGFMKDNETLGYNDQMIASWKNQVTNRFDLKRFQVENRDLHAKYIYQQPSRVLRIKGEKNAA